MRRLAPLVLLPLLLAATAAPGDSEELFRAGNAAFARGDYARAVALYEKAEVRTTDPGMVMFNLAAAYYHLARHSDLKWLPSAESAYRVCAARPGPRRAQALYGLANCLLLRGGQGTPDGLVLRVAIDTYTRCLGDPGCDEKLAGDARYNRGRARLVLLQVPPREGSAAEQGAANEEGGQQDTADDKHGQEKNGAGKDGKGEKKPVGVGPGAEGPNGEKKEGGEGTGLPGQVVSDRPDAPDLPEPEAAALLRRATRRIVEDSLRYRRELKRPTGPGVRDW